MEDPCAIQDSVDRDPECDNPVIMYNIAKMLEKVERNIRNEMLIMELKNLIKSTPAKRQYDIRSCKGRK